MFKINILDIFTNSDIILFYYAKYKHNKLKIIFKNFEYLDLIRNLDSSKYNKNLLNIFWTIYFKIYNFEENKIYIKNNEVLDEFYDFEGIYYLFDEINKLINDFNILNNENNKTLKKKKIIRIKLNIKMLIIWIIILLYKFQFLIINNKKFKLNVDYFLEIILSLWNLTLKNNLFSLYKISYLYYCLLNIKFIYLFNKKRENNKFLEFEELNTLMINNGKLKKILKFNKYSDITLFYIGLIKNNDSKIKIFIVSIIKALLNCIELKSPTNNNCYSLLDEIKLNFECINLIKDKDINIMEEISKNNNFELFNEIINLFTISKNPIKIEDLSKELLIYKEIITLKIKLSYIFTNLILYNMKLFKNNNIFEFLHYNFNIIDSKGLIIFLKGVIDKKLLDYNEKLENLEFDLLDPDLLDYQRNYYFNLLKIIYYITNGIPKLIKENLNDNRAQVSFKNLKKKYSDDNEINKISNKIIKSQWELLTKKVQNDEHNSNLKISVLSNLYGSSYKKDEEQLSINIDSGSKYSIDNYSLDSLKSDFSLIKNINQDFDNLNSTKMIKLFKNFKLNKKIKKNYNMTNFRENLEKFNKLIINLSLEEIKNFKSKKCKNIKNEEDYYIKYKKYYTNYKPSQELLNNYEKWLKDYVFIYY